jgi:hypothetical protein
MFTRLAILLELRKFPAADDDDDAGKPTQKAGMPIADDDE